MIPFIHYPTSRPDFSWNPHITLLNDVADRLGLSHSTSTPYETSGGILVPNFLWICLPEQPNVSPFNCCLKYDVTEGKYIARTIPVRSPNDGTITLSTYATTRETAVDGAVGMDNNTRFRIEDLDRNKLEKCLTEMLDILERKLTRSATDSIERSASLLEQAIHG